MYKCNFFLLVSLYLQQKKSLKQILFTKVFMDQSRIFVQFITDCRIVVRLDIRRKYNSLGVIIENKIKNSEAIHFS